MSKSKVFLTLSVLVGVSLVVLATATFRDGAGTESPTATTHAEQSPKSQPTYRQIVVQGVPGRLSALEREVARLRGGRSDDNERSEPPVAPMPSPEEERMLLEARFSELEHRLQADPVDPFWSGGATESLRSGLSATAGSDGFDLVAAECRTEMCRATLRWKNYAAAVETGLRLPERVVPGLNCAMSIWLKEPDDPSASYVSNLFLDCSEQRAGIADVVDVTNLTGGVL